MATMKTLNGYGFNATEFNGKTSDNYLKKTDTASDSEKLGGKAPEYYIQPRNLLNNSDFRNPVNQRGVTNTSTVGYCIDRWLFSLSGSGGLSVQDGLLMFNASDGSYCEIVQIQESSSTLSEKEMTFAVCIAPDNIMCLNFTYGTNASVLSADGNITLIHHNGDRLYIRFFSTGDNWIGVKWAALYEGTYTADTLPPYVPKEHDTELYTCLRYYKPIPQYFQTFVTSSGVSQGYVDVIITLDAPMYPIKSVSLTMLNASDWSPVAQKRNYLRLRSFTATQVAIGSIAETSTNGYISSDL